MVQASLTPALGADIGIETAAGVVVLIARGTPLPHRFHDQFSTGPEPHKSVQTHLLARRGKRWRTLVDLPVDGVDASRGDVSGLELECVVDELGCLTVRGGEAGAEPTVRITVPGLPVAGVTRRRPRTANGLNAALREILDQPFDDFAHLSPQQARWLQLQTSACEVPPDLPDDRHLEAVKACEAFGFFAQELARSSEPRRGSAAARHLAKAHKYHEQGRRHLARVLMPRVLGWHADGFSNHSRRR